MFCNLEGQAGTLETKPSFSLNNNDHNNKEIKMKEQNSNENQVSSIIPTEDQQQCISFQTNADTIEQSLSGRILDEETEAKNNNSEKTKQISKSSSLRTDKRIRQKPVLSLFDKTSATLKNTPAGLYLYRSIIQTISLSLCLCLYI